MRKFIVILSILILSTLSLPAGADNVIRSFSGSGMKDTRPIKVAPGWEIRWHASGSVFQIYLYSANGELKGFAANQMGPGSGSSYQATGGDYYLKVNAIGPWKIEVVQLSAQSAGKTSGATGMIAQFSGSGMKNTRPFETGGPWEIHWNANGAVFQIYLYTADGQLAGVAANQQGAGKGSSYQPKPGKYYLTVNAMGNWAINIVAVKK